MYHCHIQLYLIGRHRGLFQRIKDLPPLAGFDHGFIESDTIDTGLLAQANVILADLCGETGTETLHRLIEGKGDAAELIVLVDREQRPLLLDSLPALKDIWIAPLPEEELDFRFRHLQEEWKRRADGWQASQYLEATINSVPMTWKIFPSLCCTRYSTLTESSTFFSVWMLRSSLGLSSSITVWAIMLKPSNNSSSWES